MSDSCMPYPKPNAVRATFSCLLAIKFYFLNHLARRLLGLKTAFAAVLVALTLSACGGGGGSAPARSVDPVIGEVFTDVFNYHPSFYGKWLASGPSIRYTFLVQLDDPQGLNTLERAYIRDKTDDIYFDLIGGASNNYTFDALYDSFYEAHRIFTFRNNMPDEVNLNNWEVFTRDLDGNESVSDFSFRLPDGTAATGSQYLYSPVATAPDSNGVAALKAMTIADNQLSIVSNAGSQSFRIEFEVDEPLAYEYYLWFYDNTASIDFLGRVSQVNSASVTSTAINQTGLTQLDLPWSELDFNASVVGGIHIVLYTEPGELAYNSGPWIDHLSVSEYVEL